MSSPQEFTMIALTLRHPKLWIILLAISVTISFYERSYLDFLKEWLPLAVLFALSNLISPVNKLKSLSAIYKAPIAIFGLAMIAWGLYDLYRLLPGMFGLISGWPL
jgi:hypothetical protein